MIRVNLLLVDRKARKKKKPPMAVPVIAIGIVMVTMVSLVFSAYMFIHLNGKISKLNGEKQVKAATLKNLQDKTEEVTKLDKQLKKIRDNIKLIADLRTNQSVPVTVLDEVSKLLPNNVWLTGLDLTGNSLTFSGTAFTNDDVVMYVNNLKGSKLFKDVYLKTTKSATEKGETEVPVYTFDISMSVVAVTDTGTEKKG